VEVFLRFRPSKSVREPDTLSLVCKAKTSLSLVGMGKRI
jgi:hypothetical protein